MPVMGPDSNEENADKAHQEILQLIKEKYHVSYDHLMHPKMYKADMDAELEKLHQAIRAIFRLNSWDSW
jgi:hypothetical protein